MIHPARCVLIHAVFKSTAKLRFITHSTTQEQFIPLVEIAAQMESARHFHFAAH